MKKTAGSLLMTAGNPGRDRFRKYAELDLLSTFLLKLTGYSQFVPFLYHPQTHHHTVM